jgi:acyl-CoA synthetase
MPSWTETLAVLWAGFRIGATMVPIIHFYGPNEVRFIVRQSGARALVIPDGFGGIDHIGLLASVRDELPGLETVVVDGPPERVREVPGAVALAELAEADPLDAPLPVDPDAPAMIGYTSGTTADPKGVIHSHRTLLSEVRQLASLNVMGGRPSLMASPMAHMTGMLGGSLTPLQQGNPIELIDHWDPGEVLAICAEHDLSPGGGATIFLTTLLDHPSFGPEHLEAMPRFGLGGAPVPRAVGERAEALGIRITRAYGSTEHPSITGSTPDAPAAKRIATDGAPLPGVEIRLVGPTGEEVTVGSEGEILSRGPDLFIGYTDPALTAAAIDATAGTARATSASSTRTATSPSPTGSATSSSGAASTSRAPRSRSTSPPCPGVAEVAVVAAPDERLGEHACAFVRPAPGSEGVDLAPSTPTWSRPVCPSRSGPRRCGSSNPSTAPPRARSASAPCGSGCRTSPADQAESEGGGPAPARRASSSATPRRSTLPESSHGSWSSSVKTARCRGTL